jgi:hypothetical protein
MNLLSDPESLAYFILVSLGLNLLIFVIVRAIRWHQRAKRMSNWVREKQHETDPWNQHVD